jgi:hypothetical protein
MSGKFEETERILAAEYRVVNKGTGGIVKNAIK